MKSDKTSYIIYADIESLIRKIDRCANNPENYLTTKVSEHITCEFSMSTISMFDHLKNRHTLYRGKDCMKTFRTSLREHAKKMIDFENKKNATVNKRTIKIEMQKFVTFEEKES